MKVAVIGEYESPGYPSQLDTVRLMFPEETILDLGRHKAKTWDKLLAKKFQDIEDAHVVVNVCANFMDDNKVDVKIDLGEAQRKSRDMKQLTPDGRIVPFTENFKW